MRSLGVRLALAFLAVIVVSVGGVAVLAGRETANEFQTYVERGRVVYLERVGNGLAGYYRARGTWSGVEPLLEGWLRGPLDRLAVADANGIVVADTAGRAVGESAADAGLGPGTALVVDNQQAGTLYATVSGAAFHHPPQAIALDQNEADRLRSRPPGSADAAAPRGSPREREAEGPPRTAGGLFPPAPSPTSPTSLEAGFLERVDRAILYSAGAAAALAGLLSLLLARQLAHPLRELAAGARRVAAGDLTHRVAVRGADEVGAVAVAFNDMAASLERAEQARRALIADVAHELRTPLTVIEGTVEAMVDGVYPADAERLGSIREEVALLTKLVADLRELSLAEAGGLRLEPEPLEPAALVRRAVAAAGARAEARHVNLVADVADDLPLVSADAARVTQVFGILLDNALRYTPAGGQVIVGAAAETRVAAVERADDADGVLARWRHAAPHAPERPPGAPPADDLADQDHHRAAPRAAAGRGVRFWVADNGSGIGPDDLPHIFERFYRADPSRARRSGGSGLGLAIARRYVEAHGGVIWAQSPSVPPTDGAPGGRGTTIAFWLPATVAAGHSGTADAPSASRPAADGASAAVQAPVLRAWARLARP
ncbi:MAG TPA: ATP-binding protein [Chloroflexota bacterium]|nr:ATP-binding protein [Chloroflexota bacterium]